MQLETRLECVESLLRLSGACQDGAREFVRRRPRLTGRLSGIAQKLLGIGIGKVKGITFPEILAVVPPVSDSCTIAAQESR
ncbi:hypothetical protein B296_00038624 [Ensete ventricosum]|uniref:Uncharacterized protein n=1 Tax=Ensete ventricosum TaxID=4639 RepID=A0A426ZVV5_ENSVE|nr:hypothetical protein B296_00038624 [Ensete ventricosum]